MGMNGLPEGFRRFEGHYFHVNMPAEESNRREMTNV